MDIGARPGAAHGVVAPLPRRRPGTDGPTRGEIARAEWRRSSYGLYVPSDVEQTPEQRIVEAGALVPGMGAVNGWAALRWRGGRWFGGVSSQGDPIPVDITSHAHKIRPQPGFHVTGDRCFAPLHAERVDGVVVAFAVVAAFFLMRFAPTAREAGVALAMAAYDDLVSVDEMMTFELAHPARTGVQQCRDTWPRVVENCWSPQEYRMLWDWEDLGHQGVLANRPLFDLDGRHIGTPDLVDPVAGVIGQYHGGLHLVGDQPAVDRAQDALYAEHGLEQVTVWEGDLRRRFPIDLRAAYDRASLRPKSDRTWTTELPPWWVPTFTVEQRRALSAAERDRWLRYRAA